MADLATSLSCHAIDRASYMEGMRSISDYMMDQVEQLLGKKRFLAIYGDAGRHPDGLIDPEAFLSSAPVVPDEPTAE